MGSIAAMQIAAERFDQSNIGYDQSQRWTFFDRTTNTIIPNKEADCSSMCGAIMKLGGYPVDLWGTFYTGNFAERAQAAGFTILPFQSLSQVKTGDFVLSSEAHVEFAYTATRWYSASSDEYGNITGGAAGNQTGQETRFTGPYIHTYGWDYIVRPPADTPEKPKEENPEEEEEMMKGLSYLRSDNTKVHMLFNEVSGFYQEFLERPGNPNGMPAAYNNTIAQNWKTGSWPTVTEIHAKSIKTACNAVRQGN